MRNDYTKDPSARHARYHCSTCQRPFDRRDTLARHMRIHDPARPSPKARRKSCLPCARSKIKCLGQQPLCSSCRKRNARCYYVAGHGTSDSSDLLDRASSEPDHGPSSLLEGNLAVLQAVLPSPRSGPDAAEYSALPESIPPLDVHDSVAANFLSPSNPCTVTRNDEADNDFAGQICDGVDFHSHLDWIFDAPLTDDLFDTPTLNNLVTPALSDSPNSATISDSSRSAHQYDNQTRGQAAVTSFSKILTGGTDSIQDHADLASLPEPSPHDGCSPGDPWPMEWHASATQRYFTLPPLGGAEHESAQQSTFFSVRRIRASTRKALKECLSLPAKYHLWQNTNLDNWPSSNKLDMCIDLFFAHFQPTVSIVHQPTFDPDKDRVVTLAMICIGALYTDYAGASTFSNALSELVRRLLVFMAEYDRRFVRTEGYLTAQLLQGISGYCAGSERLFELSESSRSTLIHHAKCMGLFRAASGPVASAQTTVDSAWRDWVQQERLCRIGWAVYEYDASVSYLHNNRPCLTTGDINLSLPSPDQHWTAESAQSWASLRSRSHHSHATQRMSHLMRSVFDGSITSPGKKIKDERHCFVVNITLARMIWTSKEIRSSAISDLVPDGMDEGRNILLSALNSFYECPVQLAKTLTQSELAQVVHRLYLIHLSNLYGASALMNCLYPYLRDGPERDSASSRLVSWANSDPVTARQITYHCAQILALIRHYADNSPWEPFIAFHAGVVLSCMAELLPRSSNITNCCTTLRLDALGMSTQENDRISSWIQDGGNVFISLHGVPSLLCVRGRQQVLDQTADLLKRRRVWGIAQNFTRVVLALRKNRGESD